MFRKPLLAATFAVCTLLTTFGSVTSTAETAIPVRPDTSSIAGRILGGIPAEAWAKLDTARTHAVILEAIIAERHIIQPTQPTPWAPQRSAWQELARGIDDIATVAGVSAVTIVVIVLFFRARQVDASYRNQQRMAIIDKGTVDPSLLEPSTPPVAKLLVWGIVLACGGLGVSIWGILDITLGFPGPDKSVVGIIGPGITLLLAGLGMLLAARMLSDTTVESSMKSDTSTP
jgi:hypothetical protein